MKRLVSVLCFVFLLAGCSGGPPEVVTTESGLQIIDLSDPLAPRPLGTYESLGDVSDLAVFEHYAYLAGGDLHGGDLQVIDVSDPANPTEIAYLASLGYHVQVQDTYVYIVGADLRVIDVSDPRNPVEVETYDLGSSVDFDVMNGRAYLADGYNLHVVDVSEPTNPTY